MANILLLEDEQDIRELIKFTLKKNQISVTDFTQVDDVLNYLTTTPSIDLFLLDWMVPGKLSGLDLCKQLRTMPEFKQTPIIMLTALTEPENIVQALDSGANDYLTKPFDLNVLLARLRVQLRKNEKLLNSDILTYKTIKLSISSCKVWVDSEEISLTLTEFKILQTLIEKPGHVFTREALINRSQGEQIFVTSRTIDTHMAGLRKKVGPIAFEAIETIRGIGYRLKDDN